MPTFCVVLQQSDESEQDMRTNWESRAGEPFKVAVQILSCDDEDNHHQEAPKEKEERKNGLADPEDLQKDLKRVEWC